MPQVLNPTRSFRRAVRSAAVNQTVTIANRGVVSPGWRDGREGWRLAFAISARAKNLRMLRESRKTRG
ncbi:hypothetical protein [Caudoviricetes sp.]|nr:hypothetical protein [Caudoviricetes sp.]